MKKILTLLSIALFAVQTVIAQPRLMDENEQPNQMATVSLKNFEKENMVEIIPKGKKVVLEDFAGTKGEQSIYGYSISKYEVTQSLFFTVMGFNPSESKKGYDAESRPVETVTWYDAVMFCNELTKKTMSQNDCCYTITNIKKNDKGNIIEASVTRDESKKGYRLPTEAEWEMAARGGVKGGWDYEYAGSNKLDEVAWYGDNSSSMTHKVGTKKPNAAGLYDMSGNVCEWCYDPYENFPSNRVTRGGAWDDDHGNDGGYDYISYCSVWFRIRGDENAVNSLVGFRVCRSL